MKDFKDYPENDVPVSIMMPAEGSDTTADIEPFMKRGHTELWITVRDGRRLLLKGLPAELRAHPEEVARLRKEYSIGVRVDHPGIARVFWFEAFPETGSVIVMEYVDGIPLSDYLKGNTGESHAAGLPDCKTRRRIAFELAETLEYIHSAGFSHRDLKPDNILITVRGARPKIIDFGLGDSDDFLLYKKSLATPQFGAPEQQQPSVADSRADVYSFGRILELLLPERRFRKLRESCMAENPEERIRMEEVVRILDPIRNPEKNSRVVIPLIAALGICLSVATLFFTFYSQAPGDDSPLPAAVVPEETYVENPKTGDTLKKEIPSVNPPTISEVKTPEGESRNNYGDKNGQAEMKPYNPPAATPEHTDLSKWIEKYNNDIDKVFKKYGPRKLSWPPDPDSDIGMERMDECKAIADRAEKEMEAAGLRKGDIEQIMQGYWHHYTMVMNRTDGLY